MSSSNSRNKFVGSVAQPYPDSFRTLEFCQISCSFCNIDLVSVTELPTWSEKCNDGSSFTNIYQYKATKRVYRFWEKNERVEHTVKEGFKQRDRRRLLLEILT